MWKLHSSAGAEQGLVCMHGRRNVTGRGWKCSTNVTVLGRELGFYTNKNFCCKAGGGG